MSAGERIVLPASSRRTFCCGLITALPASVLAAEASSTEETQAAETILISRGAWAPHLSGFDEAMRAFMVARRITAAALAIAHRGAIIYEAGFSVAGLAPHFSTRHDTPFRIASVSKPITAVAILQLIQKGLFSLATPAVELLDKTTFQRAPMDARWSEITVGHLLHHTAGWDSRNSFDPMFRDRAVAAFTQKPLPVTILDIIHFMMAHPLQHAPGKVFAYSNFGYCLLGRIIEQCTGTSYEQHVTADVFGPLGLTSPRLAHTLPHKRLAAEPPYRSTRTGRSVLVAGEEKIPGETPEKIPAPDGTFNLENMDAHGGWLGSAPGLARFAAALQREDDSPLLDRAHFNLLFSPPDSPPPRPKSPAYACGWMVRTLPDGGLNAWHNGSIDGTYALLVRRADGLSWAVMFNQRDDLSGLPYHVIDSVLNTSANAVEWP